MASISLVTATDSDISHYIEKNEGVDMHALHQPHYGHGEIRLPGQRAKRGDVQAAVIALLGEQDMHGYQIIQELSERSAGAWNPSPGSVYPALQALEGHDLVSSADVGGRRVFSLTELGRKHAAMLPEQAPWEAMAEDSDGSRRLRDAFHGLMSATVQAARTGNNDYIERTACILAAARKSIYLMLAGDE
ncbi:MAG: PadR family transcriptional regulator [Coriobacteriia bacterium]|nr:PadR family transcriptional regulator [Coriobacteriia bacterium]